MTSKLKLLMLDLDGTLAEFKTGVILPNVKETLSILRDEGIKMVVCTNQGGVGLRRWMQSGGFGGDKMYDYPTEAEARAHVANVLKELELNIPVYFSFAYQSAKSGAWSPTPAHDETEDMKCWQRHWRKPESGMLIQAMKDAEIPVLDEIGDWGYPVFDTTDILYVGDWGEDESAAMRVSVAFRWADEFFNRLPVQES